MSTPLILAIDTCTRSSSIAIGTSSTVLGEHTWRTDRHHTADVSRRVLQLCTDADVRPADLNAVAVALGPGSFTGVRCGLAIAKGMVAASDAKLIGVSAFDIVLAAQPRAPHAGQPVIVAIEAGRKRVACRRFPPGNGDAPFALQTHEEFVTALPSPCYVCGDVPTSFAARDLLQQAAPAWLNVRRASLLLGLAAERHAAQRWDDPATLAPMYPP